MFQSIITLLRISFCCLICGLLSQPAAAKKKVADYGVGMGFGLFGGAFYFAHHRSPQTTVQFGLGGLPELNLENSIDEITYDQVSSSSWTGVFLHHRPIKKARWFRLSAGLGIGNIQHQLSDSSNNLYRVDYTANPVGYTGLGVGGTARKGFTIGADIGLLQTAGPDISVAEARPTVGQSSVVSQAEKGLQAIEDSLLFGAKLPSFQIYLGVNF